MIFAFWCVLFAAFLPLIWAMVTKNGVPYDNRAPRECSARASGYRQRANWAQQNAWEAFSPFAAAVIIAYVLKLPVAKIDAAAGVFVAARVAHGLCYLTNAARLRSLCWVIGFGCVIYLFVAAAS